MASRRSFRQSFFLLFFKHLTCYYWHHSDTIPYFESVLIKKHGQMTGEEIKKTDIARREMELLKENWALSEAEE